MTSVRSSIALLMLPALLAVTAGCSATHAGNDDRQPGGPAGEIAGVARVLDDFHDAAAKADEARYFGHFTHSGVFLGTDATERWTTDEFRAYAHARFATGKGWTYVPSERHVAIASGGRTAWFDEMLDNAKYGRCRGSGVLVKAGSQWKVAQYNLSVPVPNDLMESVTAQIKQMEAGKAKPK